MKNILIIYYSQNGSTKKIARLISRGIEMVEGVTSVLRTVESDHADDAVINDNDLEKCDGLILGSPTHFGNMAAPLKKFIDSTTSHWFNGTLAGKLGGAFTSTSSIHGGQETTLISMFLPLIHHGMIIMGIPYSDDNLSATRTGGTPYGPSHVSFNKEIELSKEEQELCISYGKRFAQTVKKLN